LNISPPHALEKEVLGLRPTWNSGIMDYWNNGLIGIFDIENLFLPF
jgi:hypothetical protein